MAQEVPAGEPMRWTAPRSMSLRRRPTLITFQVPESYSAADLPVSTARVNGVVTIETETPTRTLMPLLIWADVRGLELEGLSVTQPSLEDVYLQLTREAA